MGLSQTPITCGQTVAGTTTSPSQIVQYSYNGTAGQVLSFAFVGGVNCPDGLQLQADIYNPNGQLITTLYGCGPQSANLTLTNSGTYTILVHADGYGLTGSYALSIQSVTGGGCNSTPIACGQAINTNLSVTGQIDAYGYSGAAGQVLSFAFVGGVNCPDGLQLQADIYNPNGQRITTLYGCGPQSATLTLTNSGTYTILVHADGYGLTGSYALSIQSVTGGGCNSTPIACGQAINTNLSVTGQIDAYGCSGAAGQVLSFAFVGGVNCPDGLQLQADIYNPNGQRITTLYGCGPQSANLTLTNSGTYTILVHADGYGLIGSYALSIQSVTGGGCNSTAIACGQTVNSQLTLVSEMNAYGFGYGGGLAIFSFSGYSGAQFDLYDPRGNRVFTGTPGTAPSTNLAAGTYTLLVHDSGYSGTGSYGFTVTCLGPCNYLISPTSVSVGGSATNDTVTVTVGSGCAWTATNNVSWLTITSGSSGTGNGTVSYTVAANCSASERAGSITISPAGTNGGWAFNVYQANPVILGAMDIGEPGVPGSWEYTNCSTYIVSGSGEGTDGSADVFYFFYQTLEGNAQIMARLQSLQGGDPHLAAAGVMIRESLDPGSEQVSLSVNASTNVIFSRRLATNDLSILNSHLGTNYLWLRLMRMNNTFVAHYSTNGLNWQYMWFTTVNMSNQVQVGLAVTAHHYGELATATFDNVSIGSLTPLSGTWPLPGPVLLLGGQNWSPAEFQRVGGFEFLLGGVVGDYFSIKGSTNITTPVASWSLLTTVTNTYGVVPALDVQAPTNNMRFYRAQRLGP
jgi:hypothetical protein